MWEHAKSSGDSGAPGAETSGRRGLSQFHALANAGGVTNWGIHMSELSVVHFRARFLVDEIRLLIGNPRDSYSIGFGLMLSEDYITTNKKYCNNRVIHKRKAPVRPVQHRNVEVLTTSAKGHALCLRFFSSNQPLTIVFVAQPFSGVRTHTN